MKHMTKYFGLILLLTFFGCANSSDSTQIVMSAEEVLAPAAEQRSDKAMETIERKLIKEGRVEFESDDLNSTRKAIFEAVNKHSGYVSSDQEFKSPGRQSNTIIVRVPADEFDNFLSDATQGVDKFDSKAINVKDVTEEFLNVQARLKTKKELEERYIELLKQAKDVIEILEIEKQIGQLRSEIESIEGRLKYLQDRVAFSTLTMTFYETIPDVTEFSQKFKNGFKNGWDNLIWFFVALINIWPFILIGLGLIVGIRLYARRK